MAATSRRRAAFSAAISSSAHSLNTPSIIGIVSHLCLAEDLTEVCLLQSRHRRCFLRLCLLQTLLGALKILLAILDISLCGFDLLVTLPAGIVHHVFFCPLCGYLRESGFIGLKTALRLNNRLLEILDLAHVSQRRQILV